jgi:hypothetical protein
MSEASSAAHAGKETIGEFVKVASEYFAPFAGVVAGFFSGPKLGGGQSVANLIWNTGAGKAPGASANRIGGAVMAILWAMVGGGFWSIRSKGGTWMKALGGFGAGFFWGASLSNVPTVINGTQPTAGWLDSLAGWAEGVAGGN